MPRAYEMSWDAGRARWTKMYRGERFTVAASVLGGAGKEDTRTAANEWWRKKRAELDGAPEPRSPILDVLEEWRGKPLVDEIDLLTTMMAFMEEHKDKHLPPGVAEKVLGEERVAQLKAGVDALLDGPTAPPGRSLKEQAEAWHQTQAALVSAGQMSADRAGNNRTCLVHFVNFAGPGEDVDAVDATKLQGFYLHCLGQVSARRATAGEGWSLAYARDVFSTTRTFIRWLAEQDTIPLPKNIASRSFKFGGATKAVEVWSEADFQRVTKEAKGKLKLAMLLMVNCGFTQADCSDLLDSEVDWTAGRILRKRSKTKNTEAVPVVDYLLWPSTFQLLREHRSGTERVLLTDSGRPYVRKELRNGKTSRADGFHSTYLHLQARLEFWRPLKELRKLGASLLATHEIYGRFVSYYLGHAPRSVADRHYAVPPQELFDQAILWLGQQLRQG